MSELHHFQDQEIVIIETERERALTAESVGKALDYADPTDAISAMHRRCRAAGTSAH